MGMMRRCSAARHVLRRPTHVFAICIILAWCSRNQGKLSTCFMCPITSQCSAQVAGQSWAARLGVASLFVAPWSVSAATGTAEGFDPELGKLGIEVLFGLVTLEVLLSLGKNLFRREACKVSHILVAEKELAD